MSWQSAGAVSALACGCRGDGVADDYAALQACVAAHPIVVLPKGFYRLSQPLVLGAAPGSGRPRALVGVGRTLSFIMPTSSPAAFGERPVVDVLGDGITVGFLTVVTWDHIPDTYALHWRGARSVWRAPMLGSNLVRHRWGLPHICPHPWPQVKLSLTA